LWQYDTLSLPNYTASETQLSVLFSLNVPRFSSLKSFDIPFSVKRTQTDCTDIKTHRYCKHTNILRKKNVTRKRKKAVKNKIYLRGEQVPGAGSPRRLNFVHWRLICIVYIGYIVYVYVLTTLYCLHATIHPQTRYINEDKILPNTDNFMIFAILHFYNFILVVNTTVQNNDNEISLHFKPMRLIFMNYGI
jgi:hypothetical protein